MLRVLRIFCHRRSERTNTPPTLLQPCPPTAASRVPSARVAEILGAPIIEEVHNHHNYAWREEHNGEQLWVVRKGATPASPGQRGFVGGTMGEQSVILEGIENEHARYSLYSTVHGAGRALGRREATGVVDRKTGEVRSVRLHLRPRGSPTSCDMPVEMILA